MSFKYERFLIEAIEQCHLHKIITCIKHGHNIHIKNNLGQNLLVHLLKQQNFQDLFFEKKRLHMFQFLITHCNLEIHSFDDYGKNLFNWTTNLNCTQEALYLLRSYPGDIDMLIRDNSGLCSLHYAIEHGNETLVHAIVNYLLQYRIRFDILDNHNNTPEELARKLGYDHISEYLSETCRSTLFMSREIPFHQYRPFTNKSRTTTYTKSSATVFSSSTPTSTSTSSFSNTIDFYHIIESKIKAAKDLSDWKTVALLRSYQTNPRGKKLNQLPIPTLHINKRICTPNPSPIPFKAYPINITSSSVSGGQSGHMLHLLEPQITSSYRQPFIPYYERPVVPVIGIVPPSIGQRKMSVASSRRMSSVMSMRRRESNVSQLGVLSTQDGQNRLSLPPVYKQHRQSIVAGRLSDSEALTKLQAKHMITS